MGLKELSKLTSEGIWTLRVFYETWAEEKYNGFFHIFKVGQAPRYELKIGGYDDFSTMPPDILLQHNGQGFSTLDLDQDGDNNDTRSCSEEYGNGGWWFNSCYRSNFNGLNRNPGNSIDKKAMAIFVLPKKQLQYEYKNVKKTVMQMKQIRCN